MKLFSIFKLGLKSMLNRKDTFFLSSSAIALSVLLLLSINIIQNGVRKGFLGTVSSVDMIVGAKTGEIQLLLYSVFNIGRPSNNISWESYQSISKTKDIAWSVPISLGDSHKNFRVVGTTNDFFIHYEYSNDKKLNFKQGAKLSNLFDVVIGANVAKKLNYSTNKSIILSHGVVEGSSSEHQDKPFRIVGILENTATPVDDALYVSLEAIEALHVDWNNGIAPLPGEETNIKDLDPKMLKPKSITAFYVGLANKFGIFRLRKDIDTYPKESLMAIIPGLSFAELWKSIGLVEKTLNLVSYLVLISGILGMLAALLSSLKERRREMAILRSLGASPSNIFFLLCSESLIISFCGAVVATFLAELTFSLFSSTFANLFKVPFIYDFNISRDLYLIAIVSIIGSLAGTLPAFKAYRNTLVDGLSVNT